MARILVSIVTGFLGAGKTTFLNRLIATGALDRAALVINEFGDIGIDHLLIETADEGIVELSGGCLCCSLRGDLADTLSRLAMRDPAPERIVIETTGLADPGPIAQTVIANTELNQRLGLAGILALIDSADGPALLKTHEEARRQIAMADRVVVTKGDVKERAVELEAMLRAINPAAAVLDGALEPSLEWLESAVISSSTNEMSMLASLSPLAGEMPERSTGKRGARGKSSAGPPSVPPSTGMGHLSRQGGEDRMVQPRIQSLAANSHPHETSIKAIALSAPNPVPLSAIELFLDRLLVICGNGLLRVKGLVCTARTPDQLLLIQGVAQSFDTPRTLPNWPDSDTTTRLVIIGKNLDEPTIRRLFNGLTGKPVPDAPDRPALEESPLSVPGFV